MKTNDEYKRDLFTNIYDDTPYGIMIMDDRVIIEVNEEVRRLLQYDSKADLIGLSPQDISPEFQANGILSSVMARINFSKAVKEGYNEFDWLHQKKNGEILWIHVVLKRLGNYKSIFVSYWQDITEQRKVEYRFQNFMENFPGGVYIKDENLNYTYMNRIALQNANNPIELDDILNKNLKAKDIYDNEIADSFTSSDKILVEDRKLREDIMQYGPENDKKWLRSIKFIYKDADYKDYIGGISVDITELIEAKQNTEEVMESLLTTIQSITESRDPYTSGHEVRVSSLSVEIGKRLKLEEKDLKGLRIASLLHDVGKVYIPIELTSKPGRLNDKQYKIIQQHASIGAGLLSNVTFECPVGEIIKQHHESMDGTGYPAGLVGENILLEARIIRVADVFEAMTHHRPYRPRLKDEEVIAELLRNKDIKYDGTVVDTCIEIYNDNLLKLNGWNK